MIRGFGYYLVKRPGIGAYGSVLPTAGFSPWNIDPDFARAYGRIRAHTLVDVYRCWELWTTVAQCARLGGDVLEVGVWQGGTGALMAQRLQLSGSPSIIYLCDTFAGVVKAGAHDTVYRGGEHADTSAAKVSLLLDDMGLSNARILQGVFPDETADQIPGEARFCLCHIDVDVYQSARDVFEWVWARLVPGGTVVFDDYGFEQCPGIRQFVDEQRDQSDRIVLHNLNGHAIVLKLARP